MEFDVIHVLKELHKMHFLALWRIFRMYSELWVRENEGFQTDRH